MYFKDREPVKVSILEHSFLLQNFENILKHVLIPVKSFQQNLR